MAKPEPWAYVAFRDCGCAVAAAVAGVESERSERALLKKWVRRGLRIRVMRADTARKQQGFLNCIHADPKHRPTSDLELDTLVAKARR